ncbi:MAG: hypothetical protein KatS3mg031_0126 [Chitinophagales bacterium]|nr:MAG: hypothetical protein KatS3mg031_0126 [Chitinophagales bacterium]
MKSSLPEKNKITVYIYCTNGAWRILFENYAGHNTQHYANANEALNAARSIFQLTDRDPEIIIRTSAY